MVREVDTGRQGGRKDGGRERGREGGREGESKFHLKSSYVYIQTDRIRRVSRMQFTSPQRLL